MTSNRSLVGGFANDGQFFQCIASSHLSRHHQPGVNPDTHDQLQVFFRLETGIKGVHILKYRQTGPHCSLGVVFVGLGVAEVDQQAIAEVLGYVSVKGGYGSGADLLVAADHVPKYFWV